MTGSPLRLGAIVTVATLGIAAIAGLIAVVDAGNVFEGFGTGLGIAFLTFLVGATIVCALACLARRSLELVALASIAASGLALDLLVLAIWLDIDSEAYGKVAGIAFAWSFYALVVLGLALAVPQPGQVARLVALAATATTVVAGLITTWLIATTEGSSASVDAFGVTTGSEALADDGLVRALGAAFVLISALWIAAIAADRLEREQPALTR